MRMAEDNDKSTVSGKTVVFVCFEGLMSIAS